MSPLALPSSPGKNRRTHRHYPRDGIRMVIETGIPLQAKISKQSSSRIQSEVELALTEM